MANSEHNALFLSWILDATAASELFMVLVVDCFGSLSLGGKQKDKSDDV